MAIASSSSSVPETGRRLRRTGAGALAALALLCGAASAADPAEGLWRTTDGRGVVEIAACGASLCGRIRALPPEAAGKSDTNNPESALRRRPLCGLPILSGFARNGAGQWTDGTIYDPETGKSYDATIAVETEGALELRGYVGMPLFGRTERWTRIAAGGFAPCRGRL
jgi:uncharacterized protein (DUF2147 family)